MNFRSIANDKSEHAPLQQVQYITISNRSSYCIISRDDSRWIKASDLTDLFQDNLLQVIMNKISTDDYCFLSESESGRTTPIHCDYFINKKALYELIDDYMDKDHINDINVLSDFCLKLELFLHNKDVDVYEPYDKDWLDDLDIHIPPD